LDCNYLSNGNITAAVHKDQIDRINRTAEICNSVGLESEILDQSALRVRGIPPSIVYGFHEKIGGTINPAKYALGLRQLVDALQIPIFEGSPVQRVEPGRNVRVTTPQGATFSSMCVLATNAYSGELGMLRNAYLPLSVSVIVTERLTQGQRDRLQWPGEEGLHTTHRMIENIRLTPDRGILIGTKRARYGFGLRHPPANDPQLFGELESKRRPSHRARSQWKVMPCSDSIFCPGYRRLPVRILSRSVVSFWKTSTRRGQGPKEADHAGDQALGIGFSHIRTKQEYFGFNTDLPTIAMKLMMRIYDYRSAHISLWILGAKILHILLKRFDASSHNRRIDKLHIWAQCSHQMSTYAAKIPLIPSEKHGVKAAWVLVHINSY
jgi:FAD dependent oxidoreductase